LLDGKEKIKPEARVLVKEKVVTYRPSNEVQNLKPGAHSCTKRTRRNKEKIARTRSLGRLGASCPDLGVSLSDLGIGPPQELGLSSHNKDSAITSNSSRSRVRKSHRARRGLSKAKSVSALHGSQASETPPKCRNK